MIYRCQDTVEWFLHQNYETGLFLRTWPRGQAKVPIPLNIGIYDGFPFPHVLFLGINSCYSILSFLFECNIKR